MASRKLIIVRDDDASVLGAVDRVLRAHRFDTQVFDTIEGFLGGARLSEASCLVLDVNVNGASGIELQHQLRPFPSGLTQIRDRSGEIGIVDQLKAAIAAAPSGCGEWGILWIGGEGLDGVS